jgi:hypothetical protein
MIETPDTLDHLREPDRVCSPLYAMLRCVARQLVDGWLQQDKPPSQTTDITSTDSGDI